MDNAAQIHKFNSDYKRKIFPSEFNVVIDL